MRSHAARLAAFPLALIVAAGCFHRVGSNRPERDPHLITEAEIDAAHATDALNLISRLRGDFLVNRGLVSLTNTSASPFPVVYVDGTRYGEATILKQIPAAQVQQIRLYRAWEAQTKYGNGNAGGVIEVTTKK
jgi:outer membrane cobalamin receptor